MIPAVLHRVAIGPEPERSARFWAKFADLHPDWTLVTWSPPFSPEDFPLTHPYFERALKPAQIADLVRYEVLLHEGGVYVDWDVEPYQPFDPLLPLQGFVACEAPDRAGNAVMGFEPSHPAMQAILRLALARFDPKDIMQSGPLAVSDVVFGRKDVLVLPAGTFYEMPWSQRKAASDGEYVAPYVYAVHRCDASWMEFAPRSEHERLRMERERRRRR